MNVLAYGAEKVREIERAIGGPPPKSLLKESRAFLQRYLAERRKQREATLAEASRRSEQRRELLLSSLSKDDPRLKKLREERQAAIKRHKRRKLGSPKRRPKIEPSIGSNFALQVPPYYDFWTYKSREGPTALADASTGSCTLQVDSFGAGYCEAYALLPLLFSSPEANPMQRIAVLVDYSYSWFDIADFYVGHNDMRTRIWVYGGHGEGLVHQADLSPQWSDSANWLDDNEDSGEGKISIETYFPASANDYYAVWVEFNASVYADSGIWPLGGSAAWSGLYFQCIVPMVVFGSLF